MEHLKNMWRLQNTEIEMVRLQREWAEIKKLLAKDSGEELAEIESGIASARTKWEQYKTEYDEIVVETENTSRKLEQFDSQLYEDGSQSKELLSMQQNIEQLKKRLDALDDRQLYYIEQLDDLEKKIANETVRFQRLDEQRQSRINRLSKRRDAIRKEYHDYKNKREQLQAGIPAQLMAQYNGLVSQKKRPLAVLQGENCSSCGIAQTVLNINAVRKNGYARCINCGRILISSDVAEEE